MMEHSEEGAEIEGVGVEGGKFGVGTIVFGVWVLCCSVELEDFFLVLVRS
jgi:hypothetical protein